MTQDQENVTSMFETTRDYLETNNSIWPGKGAFKTAVNELKAGIDAIRKAALTQEAPASGVVEEKALQRAAVENAALEIGDQVAALAAATGDPKLAAEVHVTRSSLDQAQDDNLVQAAERIHKAANDNIAALDEYQITPEQLTAFENATKLFSNNKTAPRTAKATRGGARTTITDLVRTTRSLLRNRLDKLMTPFRTKNPDFYSGYFAARVIVNRAATHTSTISKTPSAKPNP